MIITEPGYYYVHHHEGREHCLIRVRYFTETQVAVFFINYTGWWFAHESRNFFIDEFNDKFIVEKRIFGEYDEETRKFTEMKEDPIYEYCVDGHYEDHKRIMINNK